MMMARYIDADALMAHIHSDCAILEDRCGLLPGNLLYEKAVMLAIQHEPTVTVPQWISVKDRMPEESGEILCYAGGSMFSAQYDDSIDDDFPIGFWKQYFDPDTYGMLGSEWNPCDVVTHWMPLPESPLEE